MKSSRRSRPHPLLILVVGIFLAPATSYACLYCDRVMQCSESPWGGCGWVFVCEGVQQPPEPRSATECEPRATGCRFSGRACTWASNSLPELLQKAEPAPAPELQLVCALPATPSQRS